MCWPCCSTVVFETRSKQPVFVCELCVSGVLHGLEGGGAPRVPRPPSATALPSMATPLTGKAGAGATATPSRVGVAYEYASEKVLGPAGTMCVTIDAGPVVRLELVSGRDQVYPGGTGSLARLELSGCRLQFHDTERGDMEMSATVQRLSVSDTRTLSADAPLHLHSAHALLASSTSTPVPGEALTAAAAVSPPPCFSLKKVNRFNGGRDVAIVVEGVTVVVVPATLAALAWFFDTEGDVASGGGGGGAELGAAEPEPAPPVPPDLQTVVVEFVVRRPSVLLPARPWEASTPVLRVCGDRIQYTSNSHSLSPGVRSDSASVALQTIRVDRCSLDRGRAGDAGQAGVLSPVDATVSINTDVEPAATHTRYHASVGRVQFVVGWNNYDVLTSVVRGMDILSRQPAVSGACGARVRAPLVFARGWVWGGGVDGAEPPPPFCASSDFLVCAP
jgi:hypothetical protein